MGAYHSTDKNHAYYKDVPLVSADPATFRKWQGSFFDYAADTTNVYFRDKLIPGADRASFTVLADKYVPDSRSVFYEDKPKIMTEPSDTTDGLNPGTNPHVRYVDAGRSGTIYYTSDELSFDLWYELAIPPAIAIIGIPESRHWEAKTKTSLSKRVAILQFIGDRVVADKLQGQGYACIEQDNIMTIYKGKDPGTSY